MRIQLANNSKLTIVALGVAVAIAVAAGAWGALWAYNRQQIGDKVLVPGYHTVKPGEITCQSMSPSCGYCPGEVINDKCYVSKTE